MAALSYTELVRYLFTRRLALTDVNRRLQLRCDLNGYLHVYRQAPGGWFYEDLATITNWDLTTGQMEYAPTPTLKVCSGTYNSAQNTYQLTYQFNEHTSPVVTTLVEEKIDKSWFKKSKYHNNPSPQETECENTIVINEWDI